jgi:uncharacterized membrane protein YkoI
MRAKGPLRFGLVALLLCGIAPGPLARDIDQDEVLQLRRGGELLPFEAVLRVALDRYPGARLLEVELEEEDGRYIYELELLTTGGSVRELEIDARSGELLQDELED